MQKTIGTNEQLVLRRILRESREVAGLTQQELADRLRTYRSRIYGYESGDRRMDLVQLKEYANALGIPLIELVQRFLDAVEVEVEVERQQP